MLVEPHRPVPKPAPRFAASPGTRVGVAAAAGVVVGAAVGFVAAWQVALFAGWDVALAVYVGWMWLSVGRMDPAATRAVALRQDLSHRVAELFLLVAAVMNLVAIGFALVKASADPATAGATSVAAVLSVTLSWATVHTVYALRYARLYYEPGEGGIAFEGGAPDYADFAYLAFTIGMTYQVSDTPFTTKAMRRVALGHTLLAYLFGAVIGAAVINVVVGLFRG